MKRASRSSPPSPSETKAPCSNLTEKGYRLASMSGYPNSASVRFAAIWIKDGRQEPCEMQYELSSEEYQKYFHTQQKKGLRPVFVTGYTVSQSPRFAAIFSTGGTAPWVAYHGLTAEEYQTTFQEWQAKGFRPISLSGYEAGDRIRFAVVFV